MRREGRGKIGHRLSPPSKIHEATVKLAPFLFVDQNCIGFEFPKAMTFSFGDDELEQLGFFGVGAAIGEEKI